MFGIYSGYNQELSRGEICETNFIPLATTSQGDYFLPKSWMNEWMNESLFPLKLYDFYKWEKREGYMYMKTYVINEHEITL